MTLRANDLISLDTNVLILCSDLSQYQACGCRGQSQGIYGIDMKTGTECEMTGPRLESRKEDCLDKR